MSSYGEIFVGEEVRDALEERYPDLKFSYIECPEEIRYIQAASEMPDEFECEVLDEKDNVIGTVRVKVRFEIENYGPTAGGRRIAAYVDGVEFGEVHT